MKNNNQEITELINKIANYNFIQLEIDKNEPKKIESRVNELNEIMAHSELSSLKDLEKFGISYEFVDSKNIDYYELLSLNQKKMYLNTFYYSKDQKLIKQYTKTRLSRVFENAFYYSFDLDAIKKEVEVLNQLTGFKHENYISDLISVFEFILSNDKDEINRKIRVLRFLRNLFKLTDSLTLKFNYDSRDYEIKSKFILHPSTFLLIKNIPSKELKNVLTDSEIIKDGSDIINPYGYKQNIIKFNIDENFRQNLQELRIHVIKEAELIAQMLEPLCIWITNYIINFDDDQTIYSTSFSNYYYRLARSFFTLKEFEKSIYWINQFFYTIENFKKPNCHINEVEFKDFESLRSKSLQKIKLENEKRLKKKQSPQIDFKSFEDARDFARNLNLKSDSEWRNYCRSGIKPIDIPGSPGHTYKEKGWLGIRDWLGNEPIEKIDYRSFNEAKKFVNALKLKSSTFWKNYCKSGSKPKDIPSHPQNTYKNKGWVDWGDWLGTEINKSNNNFTFKGFEEAINFARSLNLKSVADWREFKKTDKKPLSIPANPDRVYKNKGWVDWGDWLGTGVKSNKNKNFKDYKEARNFVRNLKFKSDREWINYRKTDKKPNNIPFHPDRVYKNNGWKNWGDWLGTY